MAALINIGKYCCDILQDCQALGLSCKQKNP